MSENEADKTFTLVSIQGAGDGNWGWPASLVMRLRNEVGEECEAVIHVDLWRNHCPSFKRERAPEASPRS